MLPVLLGVWALSFAYLRVKKSDHFNLAFQIAYNDFADKRCCCGVPNFGDVASNVIFVVAGLFHVIHRPLFGLLCIAIGFGSAYYHWQPTLARLFWDRLPMMLFLGYLVDVNLDCIPLFTAASLATLFYWKRTHDLVPYVAVQMAPILYFLCYGSYGLRTCVGFYIAAKICEDRDREIFRATRSIVSGHTLKHLLAGLAFFFVAFNDHHVQHRVD